MKFKMECLAALGGLAAMGAWPAVASENHPAPRIPGNAMQCRIMTDLAEQIRSESYNPMVGKIDCHLAFAAARLPMLPPTEPGRIVVFEPARQVAPGRVAVDIDYPCAARCGSGEEVTARLRAGRWTIVSRKLTWIS